MKNNKKKTLKGAESLPPVIAYSTPTNTNYRTVHSSQLNKWSQRDINNIPTAEKQNMGFPDVSINSSNASPASSANHNSTRVMYEPSFTPTKSKQRNSAIKLIGNSNGSKRIILRDKNFDESFNAESNDFSKRKSAQYLKNSETFDKQGKNFLKTNKNNLFQSYYDYYSDANDYKPYTVLEDGTVRGLGYRPSKYELDQQSQRTWAIVDVNSLYGKKQKKNKKKNTNKLNYLKNSVRKMF